MERNAVILITISLLLASGAQAGYVVGMDQTPIDTEALQLAPDGEWQQQRDWDYSDGLFWMMERWIGGFGTSASIRHEIDVSDRRSPTPISLQKTIDNDTSFFWTAFQMELSPLSGGTISNVVPQTNPAFDTVTVTDQGGGSWLVEWEMPPDGTGVDLGENVTLDVDFEIDGDIAFDIVQTPIPEPTTLGLLALGGLVLLRRRS